MSLKLKAILTTAMLIASMSVSVMPAATASAAADEAVSRGRQLAEANGIVLDSDADAAALAVLSDANAGELPELDFAENGTVSRISGVISGRTVRSARDAKAVLSSVAALLGISDADAELEFVRTNETDYNTAYVFRQVYQGLALTNEYVTLCVTNSTGKADYLTGNLIPDISVDTTPAINPAQVRSFVRTAFDTGLSEDAKLVIFRQEDGTLKLAYEAKTCSIAYPKVIVDANDGSILYAPKEGSAAASYYDYNSSTLNPVTKLHWFRVNTERTSIPSGNSSAERTRLHDTERNIWMLREGKLSGFETYANNTLQNYINTHGATNSNYLDRQGILNTLYGLQVNNYMNLTVNNAFDPYPMETGTLYQIAKVYDFYKNVFGRNGTDGQNGRLFVYPYLDQANAFAYGDYNLITFGRGDSNFYPWASEIDVAAHEYTHRITDWIVGWQGSGWNPVVQAHFGEAASLNEGYSDIMGEYAEEYWSLPLNWIDGSGLRRNPNDPTWGRNAAYSGANTSTGPAWYMDSYGYRHFYKVTACNPSQMECHEGATIISHVAYLMNKYGISKSIARKIWYRSMNYLPFGQNQATFLKCRQAVESAAQAVAYEQYPNSSTSRKNLLVKVASAFNYARIFVNGGKLGDINKDGYVNSSDVTTITICARDSSYISDPKQLSLGDVDFDGRVTTADAEKVQYYLIHGGSLD